MIRLGWGLLAIVISLALVGAEIWGALWLLAQAIALGVRHPWITLPTALVSFVVNRQAVVVAKRKRQNWRAAFLGAPTP